jgi:lipid-A-disaccharide synthase
MDGKPMRQHTQSPAAPTIFFSAGEPSGDVHGANLIRALRQSCPGLQAVGYGGPKMAEAGCRLHADLTALAVMWILRALLNIHRFWWLFRKAKRYFRDERPAAVVLIDFPGFNWWIARAAKKYGIPVFYYAPPQIWAWARWRVKKMRRLVDHVLCALPFEQQWYSERGCNATLVGHPFFDEVARRPLDQSLIAHLRRDGAPLVTILPGSRRQELANNLIWLLKAALRIREAVPRVRFAVAAFKPAFAEIVEREAAAAGLPVEIHVGKTPELIRAADCCLTKSGSVSLELLYHTKPTVVLYWVNFWSYHLAKLLVKVRYITLVNLLTADNPFSENPQPYDPAKPEHAHVLFPEYPTREDKSQEIAAHAIDWLTYPARREELVARLAELKARIGHPGAAKRAADYVLGQLGRNGRSVPRPHFRRQDVGGSAEFGVRSAE